MGNMQFNKQMTPFLKKCNLCNSHNILSTYTCLYCNNTIHVCMACDAAIDTSTLYDCITQYPNIFMYLYINIYGEIYSSLSKHHPHYLKYKYNESIYSIGDFHYINNHGITTLEDWNIDYKNKYICDCCLRKSDIILHPYDFKFCKYFELNFENSNYNIYNYTIRKY